MPIGVYATDRDFTLEYTIHSEALRDRITLAVARALPILNGHRQRPARRSGESKTQQANQNLGINKQIEQDEVLPSAAVPSLDAAESRLHQNKVKPQVA